MKRSGQGCEEAQAIDNTYNDTAPIERDAVVQQDLLRNRINISIAEATFSHGRGNVLNVLAVHEGVRRQRLDSLAHVEQNGVVVHSHRRQLLDQFNAPFCKSVPTGTRFMKMLQHVGDLIKQD